MTVEPVLSESGTPVSPLVAAAEYAPTETAQIARAASIISLGNVASRVLGLIREFVKSHYFGASGAVSAYEIATIVPNMLYDLLIGGMINSSLVPVFSEYIHNRRDELWRLVSLILSLTTILTAAFVILVAMLAPQVTWMLGSGLEPDTRLQAVHLMRITVPAVIFLSLSGVLSGLLYALKRFSFPAFTAAVFNAGIVLLAVLFNRKLGITSMAVGLLVGSLGQVLLQLPGLRDARLELVLSFRHPGLKRIALLYMPIALGLMVDILISRPFSYNVATITAGDGGIPWMRYATNLMQLPQGLVAIAVSFAVLPTLSAQAVAVRESGDEDRADRREDFRATLARGLRLVVVLIVPATVGLIVLARPVVALLYQHGAFTVVDTLRTTEALQLYMLGVPFAAVDLLLVIAFYAQQDTLTPSLIGVATVVVYLIMVSALVSWLGLFSLMVSESAKICLHTIISTIILRRRLGGLERHGVTLTLLRTLAAAAVMGAATYGALLGITHLFPAGGVLPEALSVILPGALGASVYLGLITLMRVEEIGLLADAVRRKLKG